MKVKNLFITLGLSLAVGLGLGAGLSLGKGEVKEAKAADSEYFFSAPSDWGDVKIYAWGAGGHNADYPGVAGSKTGWMNNLSQKIWKLSIDVTSYTQFIVSDGSDAHKSKDLNVTSLTADSDNAFWLNDDKSFGGKYDYVAPAKEIYFLNKDKYLYSDNIFIHAYGGEGDGHYSTVFPGVQMESLGGRLYKGYVYDYNTTAKFNVGEGGYQKETTGFTISNDACVLKTDWSDQWVSEEAALFVGTYLHFDHTTNDGSCTSMGWYDSLSSAYNELVDGKSAKYNPTLASEITGIEGVSERMEKWAQANGKTFDSGTGFSAARIPMAIVGKESNSTILVITIASTIALIALSGFFFIRRRKEER